MVHLAFDCLAALTSFSLTLFVYRWRLQDAGDRVGAIGLPYAAALVAGAVIGAFVVGSLNLALSGVPGVGRSIAGALAGAIVAIELYKRAAGIVGSTGIVFVPAFAASIAVGRLGCYFAGLDDFTYGTPTSLPWGTDFGDGVLRHPVQLYESAAMALFLGFALVALARKSAGFRARGFYLLVGFYAVQRFFWEFLKPYGAVWGPFNVFHVVCAGLFVYAFLMLRGAHEYSRP